MKKYGKPDLCFEDFEPAHSIASGCGIALGHSVFMCRLDETEVPGLGPGESIFSGGMCSVDGSALDDFGYCLQNFAESVKIFTS